jgi:hypothetical protein
VQVSGANGANRKDNMQLLSYQASFLTLEFVSIWHMTAQSVQ